MKFRTQYNGSEYPKNYEVNKLSSMTIPDQTMSIQEILSRYARGLPIEGKEPVYHGEEYVPDIKTMDLADRQELVEQHREHVDKLNRKFVEEESKRKAKKLSKEKDDQAALRDAEHDPEVEKDINPNPGKNLGSGAKPQKSPNKKDDKE